MSVRIRLKKMGRTHRPFYRVCAMDRKTQRDGRALEELGTYDTSLDNTDARAVLRTDRIDYWLSVGAQPSDKVAVLIKKYGTNGTHLEQQKAALEQLAQPKAIPDPGAPASLPKKLEETKQPTPEAPAAKAESAEPAPSEEAAQPAEEAAAVATEAPAEEIASQEEPAEVTQEETETVTEQETAEETSKSEE